ncbi:condensation domain-containing protein [Nonomuraea sp. NPDC049158]|uniref:condensation domain-containing protein n=1 Tax=Nonomuraea sp. NPDC049158 TaxID=3155649 RepID=UPI0033DE751F
MTGPTTPSWTQRSRLLRLVEDAAAGLYRPQHTIAALRVRGALNLSALNLAWLRLQRRHPILLTSFDPHKPLWRLDPTDPVDLVRLPLPPPADARQALVREAERPFDIERGPLARLVAIPLPDAAETLLGLVVDHLVSDAWSRRILLGDLCRLYDLEIGASTGDLPPAAAAYAGWVERQNDYLESTAGLNLRRKLTRHVLLPDRGPADRGPTDGGTAERRPVGRGIADQGLAGQTDVPRIERQFDVDSYERLLPAAKRFRLTRLQLVLAALDAASAELGDHFPAATIMAVAGRPRPELHGSVGWFADQVAVVNRGRHASPEEQVRSFREAVVTALDSARVPWALVVADTVPEWFTHSMSLPYISFNAQPLRMGPGLRPAAFAGTEIEEFPVHLGRPDGALLTYWSEDDGGGLRVALRYKPERYSEADVLALWESTIANLDRFAESAGRTVGSADG